MNSVDTMTVRLAAVLFTELFVLWCFLRDFSFIVFSRISTISQFGSTSFSDSPNS